MSWFVVGFSSARESTCCWFRWWIFETLWCSVAWTVSYFVHLQIYTRTPPIYNENENLGWMHHLISFIFILKACPCDSASSESWKSGWTQFSAWTWSLKGCKPKLITELSGVFQFFVAFPRPISIPLLVSGGECITGRWHTVPWP